MQKTDLVVQFSSVDSQLGTGYRIIFGYLSLLTECMCRLAWGPLFTWVWTSCEVNLNERDLLGRWIPTIQCTTGNGEGIKVGSSSTGEVLVFVSRVIFVLPGQRRIARAYSWLCCSTVGTSERIVITFIRQENWRIFCTGSPDSWLGQRWTMTAFGRNPCDSFYHWGWLDHLIKWGVIIATCWNVLLWHRIW